MQKQTEISPKMFAQNFTNKSKKLIAVTFDFSSQTHKTIAVYSNQFRKTKKSNNAENLNCISDFIFTNAENAIMELSEYFAPNIIAKILKNI